MIPWRVSILAAVVVLGLQGCERETPKTVVTPPTASLPDNTVLQAPGAPPPQSTAAAPSVPESTAAAPAVPPAVAAGDGTSPQVAATGPAVEGSTAPAAPAPPTSVMGAPSAGAGAPAGEPAAAAPSTAAPAGATGPAAAPAPSAADASAQVPAGTAAPTEMAREFPSGGSSAAVPSAPVSAAPPATTSATTASSATTAPSSPPAPQSVSSALPTVRSPGDPEGARLLAQRPLEVPVVGIAPTVLYDQYDLSRGSSRKHEAIDILAPKGTPVVAVDDGRIAKLFTSKPGGLTIYQFDPTSHLAYYYAHLQRYADGVHEGMDVKRGDLIGYVGSTGDADAKTPHLHFAVFRLNTPPKWWQGHPVNPYPALSQAQPAQQVAGR